MNLELEKLFLYFYISKIYSQIMMYYLHIITSRADTYEGSIFYLCGLQHSNEEKLRQE